MQPTTWYSQLVTHLGIDQDQHYLTLVTVWELVFQHDVAVILEVIEAKESS